MYFKHYSMKTIPLTCLLLMFFSCVVSAAEVVDRRRVYNPEVNECFSLFSGKIKKYGPSQFDHSKETLQKTEAILMNWIFNEDGHDYIREFDTADFHYQFIENPLGDKSRIGVIVVIPETTIDDSFYNEMGGGLEIPGSRCVNAHCAWINNGEIFSFIINKAEETVEEFKNWRFEQEDIGSDPLLAYYSQLTINYKCKPGQMEKISVSHFVDGELRDEIPVWEDYPIMLPKGKVSVLVFYLGNKVKGVLCFDMQHITKMCPLHFQSTVYMKERLGYGRILYAQPQCSGIYPINILQPVEFEELTGLNWTNIENGETIASN